MSATLVKKSKWVFETYKHLYVDNLSLDVDLRTSEKKLFDSMTRHHKNSHISPEDWFSSFQKVKLNLGTKENMTLDNDFVVFLNAMFAKTDLNRQFSVPEMLHHLEDPIRKYYDDLLIERDEKIDEFSFELFGATLPEDVRFFMKRFLPAALLYSYELKHPHTEKKDLMNDLFTLGSGAMTMSLFPEVTGLCSYCCAARVPERTLSLLEVSRINKVIFKAQVADRFCNDFKHFSDSDEDNTEIEEQCEPGESLLDSASGGKSSIFEFNPFAVEETEKGSDTGLPSERSEKVAENSLDDLLPKESSKEVDENTPSDVLVHEGGVVRNKSCKYCHKLFSRKEFVNMHVDIFHSNGKKVIPKFVIEGEEHITSFTEEQGEESQITTNKVIPKFVDDGEEHITSFTEEHRTESQLIAHKVISKKSSDKASSSLGQVDTKKACQQDAKKFKYQTVKKPRHQDVKKDLHDAFGKDANQSVQNEDCQAVKKTRKTLPFKGKRSKSQI